jgi:glycosyltransferase involved in cell wall biosynthesis
MPDTPVPDYYEILQVSPRADRETIERVFRHLANRYHPDNRESGNAEKFSELVTAHDVLSDAAKRASYDVSYERNPEWYPYKRDPLRRAFYRASARSADRVITDSQFSRHEIAAVYGLRPETIDVVALAAAPVFCDGPALPLPPAWPRQYVLHVGDLHARRNLAMLARAVQAVRSGQPEWSALGLVLAGVDRGSGAESMMAVYVPTNHLYLGDIVLYPRERALFPDLSVQEGIRIFLTGGMSLPGRIAPRK